LHSPNPISAPINPLYLDHACVIVNKAAGQLSVPGRLVGDCLASQVQAHVPDALVVHRLDQATSGLMVLARGIAMQRVLSRMFEDRRVHKTYVAVVQGLLAPDEGEVDLPLSADWPRRPMQQVHVHGKPALTRWQVLGRDPAAGTSRLLLQPLTGRTHQLRVHMMAMGHPIVGDALYGSSIGPSRMLLHAQGLQFAHPATGLPMEFDSPAPF
jgi:tRNA pseudouridine32 synthase/23S rRNA pseudouridine746 synthase